MKRINIRESLLQFDKDTSCQYDLTSLYEACALDEEDKKKLVQYIDAKDIDATNKLLTTRATEQGFMENLADDVSDDELASFGVEKETLTEDTDADNIEQKIKDKTFDALLKKYDEEFVHDYCEVKVKELEDCFEARVNAELSYSDLEDLGTELTKVITEFDPSAYFEPECPGRLVAYVRKDQSEDIVDEAVLKHWTAKFNAVKSRDELGDVYEKFVEEREFINWGTKQAIYDVVDAKLEEFPEEKETDDIDFDSEVTFDESLTEEMTSWTDVYEKFTDIVRKNFPNTELINKEVEDLYNEHKGETMWDEAYYRWCQGDESLTEEVEVIYQKGNKKIVKDSYGYAIDDGINANRFYVNDDGEPKFDDGCNSKFWLDKVNSLIKAGKLTSAKHEAITEDVPERYEFTYNEPEFNKFTVGGKDVPYTSHEEAKAHMKEDYPMESFIDELVEYMKGNDLYYSPYVNEEGNLVIPVEDGDWKHEHLYLDRLIGKFFFNRGLIVDINSEVIESDELSDCYSANHIYELKDLIFSMSISESIKITPDSKMKEIDIEDKSETGDVGHPIKVGLKDPTNNVTDSQKKWLARGGHYGMPESLTEDTTTRTVGIYGDEVRGMESVEDIVNYLKGRGLTVSDVEGDMEYGWEMNVTGTPSKLYTAIVHTFTGYNSDTVEDFISQYAIDDLDEGFLSDVANVGKAVAKEVKNSKTFQTHVQPKVDKVKNSDAYKNISNAVKDTDTYKNVKQGIDTVKSNVADKNRKATDISFNVDGKDYIASELKYKLNGKEISADEVAKMNAFQRRKVEMEVPEGVKPIKEGVASATQMNWDDDDDFTYDAEVWEDDMGVVSDKDFFAEGSEYTWVKRVSSVETIDFDNWVVWSALNQETGETEYFVVEEDTEFIDWGPVDTEKEAKEFLQSKVDEYNLDESLDDEVTIDDVTNAFKVNGPQSRQDKIPEAIDTAFNIINIKDNMRPKSYRLDRVDDNIQFTWVTQEPFKLYDLMLFEKELIRAFTEIAKSVGYNKEFIVMYDVRDRDGEDHRVDDIIINGSVDESLDEAWVMSLSDATKDLNDADKNGFYKVMDNITCDPSKCPLDQLENEVGEIAARYTDGNASPEYEGEDFADEEYSGSKIYNAILRLYGRENELTESVSDKTITLDTDIFYDLVNNCDDDEISLFNKYNWVKDNNIFIPKGTQLTYVNSINPNGAGYHHFKLPDGEIISFSSQDEDINRLLGE